MEARETTEWGCRWQVRAATIPGGVRTLMPGMRGWVSDRIGQRTVRSSPSPHGIFVPILRPTHAAASSLPPPQVRHRLLSAPWRSALRPDHLLRVLQCCRLLSRDNALRQRLVEMGGVQVGRRG